MSIHLSGIRQRRESALLHNYCIFKCLTWFIKTSENVHADVILDPNYLAIFGNAHKMADLTKIWHSCGNLHKLCHFYGFGNNLYIVMHTLKIRGSCNNFSPFDRALL
uniref:Uncharacterized protein n=1 Tax=Engystomops pustulosus TaxID=76066 RepID=A0AAV6YZW3_ENGPU|nr:hypothetical protein GDO81_025971 [Engystomops pustulosus]